MALNFGKLKQWTSEKLGNTDKTDTSEEFKELETQTEKKRETFVRLEFVVDNYLRNMGKRKTGVDKDKRTPIDDLAYCMTTQAKLFESDSTYGKALLEAGKAHEGIATVQQEFVYQARDDFYGSITKLASDMEDFQTLRKKLGTRRLDLDAKLTKVQKSKKEKPELEEELRSSQVKYDDTLSDTYNKMVLIIESEDLLVKDLVDFITIEQQYHARSSEFLKKALDKLVKINNSPSKKKDYKILGRGSSFTTIERTKSDQSSQTSVPVPVRTPISTSDRSLVLDHSRGTKTASKTGDNGKPFLPPKTFKKKVECIYAFEAEGEDELSMKIGDVITVLEEVDEGWWIGESTFEGSKTMGLFPVNYTKALVQTPRSLKPKKSRSFDEKSFATDPFGISDEKEINGLSDTKPSKKEQKANSVPYRRAPPNKPTSSKPNIQAEEKPARIRSALYTKQQPALEIEDSGNECNECECSEYSPNRFKKGQCSNCFHKH